MRSITVHTLDVFAQVRQSIPLKIFQMEFPQINPPVDFWINHLNQTFMTFGSMLLFQQCITGPDPTMVR